MKPRNQSLAGDNLQEVLDSARNATQKGAQQFLTPLDIAAALALPLPRYRGTIVDLQSGTGALLHGARTPATRALLGIDIDPRARIAPPPAEQSTEITKPGDLLTPRLHRNVIHGDLTAIYGLFTEIDWHADLFTLNPPFSLAWHKKRLAALADSSCKAVAETFRNPRSAIRNSATIDSTLATFLIALDRCTNRGEGYMICNEATARRIFGDPDADLSTLNSQPSTLRSHLWLWLTVPNFFPCVGRKWDGHEQSDMKLAVLYFTRCEQPELRHLTAAAGTAAVISAALSIAIKERDIWRDGYDLRSEYQADTQTLSLFGVAKAEHKRRAHPRENDFNLWLDGRGFIHRYLTTFQNYSGRIPKQDVKDLDALEGQSPMALVVQKATRLTLLRAVRGTIWRVAPALLVAVETALREYDEVRAPFYPLNEVQRLGYLDESDTILCKKDFWFDSGVSFVNGRRYDITTRTVPVERTELRANLLGAMEEIEITGSELLIEVSDGLGFTHGFTHDPENSELAGKSSTVTLAGVHDLPSLIEHFEIPAVPDIAAIRPAEYEANLDRLDAIEVMLAA